MTTLSPTEAGMAVCTLRTQKGISSADLAEKLGVSADELSKIERGEDRLTAGDMVRLSRIFDVPVSAFSEDAGSIFFRADAARPETAAAVRIAYRYIDFHRGVKALAS